MTEIIRGLEATACSCHGVDAAHSMLAWLATYTCNGRLHTCLHHHHTLTPHHGWVDHVQRTQAFAARERALRQQVGPGVHGDDVDGDLMTTPMIHGAFGWCV